MNNTRLIAGIVTAFAAGAVLGILFAPEKGTVLRSRIAEKSKGLADNVNKSVRENVNALKGSLTSTLK